MFGLEEKDIEFIIQQVKQYNNIEAVGVFGSRATKTNHKTSDIDIVIYGKNIDHMTLDNLTDNLENYSPYPFYVDVIHYESIKDPVFRSQIDRDVVLIDPV